MSNDPVEQPPTGGPPFPGGEHNPAYGYAVTIWIVLFLGVLCLGMLNYLGLYLKRM